ncbi:hypothetical protein AAE026_24180 [Bradyrhizobium sp. DN5]|uniref:hypothetical protein n=1 Tax=Bradyrhizobium sp. DN5 TaxID=3056950 RepID=UPI003523C7F7
MIDFGRPRLKEFHNWLADEIPCTEKEARAELHSFPLPSLLIHYLNWRDRLVPVRPRTVMTWDRFLADKRTLDHWAAVNAHVERIVAGKTLLRTSAAAANR